MPPREKRRLSKYVFAILGTLSFATFCLLEQNFFKYFSQRLTILQRILADSFVHFCVGCWCWVLVRGIHNNHIVIEICLAGLFSSAIDIDHIIEARSIYPKDLINIHHRSLFHTLTAVPVASFVVWVCSKYIWGLILKYKSLEQLKPLKGILIVSPWIIAVALTSHQLRDALRRGISLQPFGVTGPVPLWLYVAIVTIIPNFIRLLVSFLHERKQLTQ